MDSLYLLVASVLVAGLVTWRLFIGSRHESRHERRVNEHLAHEPHGLAQERARPCPIQSARYKGVSIRVCTSPCEAALRLRKKTFLTKDAPPLPLPTCDRACNCDYQYHEDRRRHADRRYPAADVADFGGINSVRESRAGKDRRRRIEPYQGIY